MQIRERIRQPVVFWFLIGSSLILMGVGHALLQGQVYEPLSRQTFNPLTFYVSDYAGKWPEGIWIKSSIICFCLALAWFCDLALRTLAAGRWAFFGRLFWFSATGVMIAGLLLVMLFDMLPERYTETHTGWFWKAIGVGPGLTAVPRSATEWSMRWWHNLGFRLFFNSYVVTAMALMFRELKNREWTELAGSIFILAAVFVFRWWLGSGTSVPGVPQRAVLILVGFHLVRSAGMLRKTQ